MAVDHESKLPVGNHNEKANLDVENNTSGSEMSNDPTAEAYFAEPVVTPKTWLVVMVREHCCIVPSSAARNTDYIRRCSLPPTASPFSPFPSLVRSRQKWQQVSAVTQQREHGSPPFTLPAARLPLWSAVSCDDAHTSLARSC